MTGLERLQKLSVQAECVVDYLSSPMEFFKDYSRTASHNIEVSFLQYLVLYLMISLHSHLPESLVEDN